MSLPRIFAQVKNSADRGALGCLIYSDPQEYAANMTQGAYPDAEWLPPAGVQVWRSLSNACHMES